jgi:hypothetical protein
MFLNIVQRKGADPGIQVNQPPPSVPVSSLPPQIGQLASLGNEAMVFTSLPVVV